MVTGLERFRDHFREYTGNYVIIGGTALQMRIEAEALTGRATRDIDMVLVVEARSTAFAVAFWDFIKEGEYAKKEKKPGEGRKYYRFKEPATPDFPWQLELFSRNPDIDLPEEAHITPIAVDDEDVSDLSAILMNDDYYHFTMEHSDKDGDLSLARTEALICLKGRAFLDMMERKERGEKVEEKHIRKHKADVFRLGAILTGTQRFEVPPALLEDLTLFLDRVASDLPDAAIYKEMGLGKLSSAKVMEQIKIAFGLQQPEA